MIESNKDGPLASSTLRQFISALSSRCSTPGGGSASAAIAAMVTKFLAPFFLVCSLMIECI